MRCYWENSESDLAFAQSFHFIFVVLTNHQENANGRDIHGPGFGKWVFNLLNVWQSNAWLIKKFGEGKYFEKQAEEQLLKGNAL